TALGRVLAGPPLATKSGERVSPRPPEQVLHRGDRLDAPTTVHDYERVVDGMPGASGLAVASRKASASRAPRAPGWRAWGRRRRGERSARGCLEDDRPRVAIEAGRALHERALRATEHAGPIERAHRLVGGIEAFDRHRSIEHGVDGADQLTDRRGTERGLEL